MKKTLYILPAIIVAAGTISTDATMARRSQIRSANRNIRSAATNTATTTTSSSTEKTYQEKINEAKKRGDGTIAVTSAGERICPLYNKDFDINGENNTFVVDGTGIFSKKGKAGLNLKAKDSVPLTELINVNKLSEYNAKYGDIYFAIKNSNPTIIGFTECYKDINLNSLTPTYPGLNSGNISNWCIKTSEASELINYASQNIKLCVANGDNEECDTAFNATEKPCISFFLSEIIEETTEKMEKSVSVAKLKEACSGVDISELKKIKNLTLTSTISSGVGALGSITGAVTSGLANTENKKEDTNASKANGLGMAATISSAIGGAGSAAGATTAGIATGKLKKVIEDIERCKSFIDSL